MKTTSKALLMAALLAPAGARAQADGPCGGIRLEDGKVVTGQPIPIEPTLTEPVAACVRAVGEKLAASRFIRGITVEAHAAGADRGGGVALGAAQRAADVLVEAGIPRQRISMVAPSLEPDAPTGLFFVYSEAPSDKPVALVEYASGAVEAGRGDEGLKPVTAGAKLPHFTRVQTGDDGHAMVLLADGSRLQLGPATTLLIHGLGLNTALKPQVQLELVRGDIEVDAVAGSEGSLFEIASDGGAAHAAGARFRMSKESGQTRLEVISGDVGFAGQQARPRPTQAAGLTAEGEPIELRAQLAPPSVVSPVLGTFRSPPPLSWIAVEGAERYRVEIARDAAFRQSMRWLATEGTEVSVGELPPGKWFWRVRAIDDEGFAGLGSKIYAITIDPDAPQETPIVPATPQIQPVPEASES